MSEGAPETEKPDEQVAPKKRPIGVIVLASVVLIGAFYGIRMYLYNSDHVTTDDSYVTTDIVPTNAQVAGNISDVLVRENQVVKAGDLLVRLDDVTYRADVEQAKANLAVAEANAKGAATDVGLTQQTGAAQVSEALGGVQIGGTDINSAEVNVQRAISGVDSAQATLNANQAQAKAADASIQTQLMDRARIVQAAQSAKAAITNAEANVKVAQANLASAQATETNAEHDAERYRMLSTEGAVPAAQAEAKETALANARASVDAARQQVLAAEASVNQRKSDYSAAQQQIKWADTSIASARAQARAAHQTASAQASRVAQANSDVSVARQGIEAAKARQTQNVGKLAEANALPKRVSLSEAAKLQAIAKVRQAQAALTSAQIALDRTRIRAATAGKVSRKSAEVGQQVAVGQPLMSIVTTEQPWIVANFKETQLGRVRPGQAVEIEIDALSGRTFKGHVDSISAGTGSTFALLPADNATGNFTKVVQRLPVKIVFEPGQPGLELLSAGLSANVAIIVK